MANFEKYAENRGKGKNPRNFIGVDKSGNTVFSSENKTKWTFVKSTNLWKVNYNNSNRILKVLFVNAKQTVYNYKDVPGNVYLGLMNAASKGEFFAENIKNIYGFYIGGE